MEREHLKSSMLRSISHDFRTPLTGIIGDCDLILQKRVTDEREKDGLVKDIREQSMWLTRNDGEYPQHDEDRERCGVYQPQRRGPGRTWSTRRSVM